MIDAIWFILLFGIAVGMCSLKKTGEPFEMNLFIKLIPIGILLLLLFVTETSQRYFIGHLPIFCIVAAHGYLRLFENTRLTT
jgi:hypothetical protein